MPKPFHESSERAPAPFPMSLCREGIISTEPAVLDNSQGLVLEIWDCLGVGWVMGRESVSDKMGEFTNIS